MEKRHFFLPVQAIYFFGLTIVLLFAFLVQYREGSDLEAMSINFIVSEDVIDAPRGLILDSRGRILAENELVYDVSLIYSSDLADSYDALKAYLSLNNREDMILLLNDINSELEQNKLLVKNLSVDEIAIFESFNIENEVLNFKPHYIRKYLYPEEFSHILGYTGPVTEEDILNGYSSDEYVGKYRVEKLYEEFLRGTKGRRIKDGLSEIQIPSKSGGNVHLTIDAYWQNTLYKLLGESTEQHNAAGGAGVIMNAKTGDIKAMVSYPGFNTNEIVRGIDPETFTYLEQSRKQPLLDKAIGGAYTPGSIFKIVTSYALLENEIITPTTQFFSNQCMQLGGGYDFCEFGKNFYGTMNLKRALEKSSNLYFCNFTLKLSEEKGISKFVETAEKFGVGSLTGIELEGENPGNMDSPEYKVSVTGESWFDGDICNAAIGQGAVVVSPIQVSYILAILANNGLKVTPSVVDYIETDKGIEHKNNTTNITYEKFNSNYAESIFEGLSGVAYSIESAVYRFLKDIPYNVKAKTGSAETYENINGVQVERVHSWIVGTFDYNNETYTFSFFHQYGRGGYYIAPLLKDFLSSI